MRLAEADHPAVDHMSHCGRRADPADRRGLACGEPRERGDRLAHACDIRPWWINVGKRDVTLQRTKPLLDLVNEYFDYTERPRQIISEKVILECCEAVVKGLKIQHRQ